MIFINVNACNCTYINVYDFNVKYMSQDHSWKLKKILIKDKEQFLLDNSLQGLLTAAWTVV